MQKNNYKIAIIGAGPAGSTCAIRLLNQGIKDVLLIESGDYEKFRIGESIPPHTNQLLYKLGIYKEFAAENHLTCFGNASAWGSNQLGYNDFVMGAHGNGWHLDRRRFDDFLAKKAQDFGATVLRNTRFIKSEKTTNGFNLILKNQQHQTQNIFTDFVVDATGKRAIFATEQGSQKINTLPIVCVGMRFKITDFTQKITKLTHLEATKNGWWYAAQIPDNQLLLAFYSDADIVKKLQLNITQNWLTLLNQTQHIKKLVQHFDLNDDRPKGFPAPSYLLDKISGDNWLAIGDAASAYDPIMAQGIIKSMLTAFFAADTLIEKINNQVENFLSYNEFVQQKFGNYLSLRTRFYRSEKRWAGSPFWKKLQEEKVEIML